MEHAGNDWKRPWVSNGMHRNFITRQPYRGINMFLTGMSGFDNPFWATYRQLQEKGFRFGRARNARTSCSGSR
jgi:antirestriction protein ArdC